jgi:hypothetical protein
MNKTEEVNFNSLFIDLDERNNDNALTPGLNELKNSGFSGVNLEVKSSANQIIKNLFLDIDLFLRIKNVQDLPDWVIVKFILTAGILNSSSFADRISND